MTHYCKCAYCGEHMEVKSPDFCNPEIETCTNCGMTSSFLFTQGQYWGAFKL
jgi:hypothetical protein